MRIMVKKKKKGNLNNFYFLEIMAKLNVFTIDDLN